VPAFDLFYPFDSGAGAVATQANWFNIGAGFQDSGILRSVPNYLRPTLTSPGTVQINTGAALIQGVYAQSTAAKTITIPTGAGTGGVIVAQADFGNRICNIVFNSAVYAPVQTTSLWELMIAQVSAGVMSDCRSLMWPVEPFGLQVFQG
jgi:hypothetical protein